jgi:hypothetical protein
MQPSTRSVSQPHNLQVAAAALAELHRLLAAYLAADAGPMVPLAAARRMAVESARTGWSAGWDTGRLDLRADEKHAQTGIVSALRESAPPACRWHVCCGPCRRGGHKPGCRACKDRTRDTFGQVHPDDFPGRGEAA